MFIIVAQPIPAMHDSSYIGPFATADAAARYGKDTLNVTWWIFPLHFIQGYAADPVKAPLTRWDKAMLRAFRKRKQKRKSKRRARSRS
jgi:hypothetical protein